MDKFEMPVVQVVDLSNAEDIVTASPDPCPRDLG